MHEELIGELQVLADAFDYGLAVKQAKTMRKAIAALSQPSGNSGQLAVDDAMVTRAINASLAHWEASMQKCNRCDGTGKTACGDSQDYCDCGGGYVSDATEESAMRAALQAVLIQPPPAAAPSGCAGGAK